MFASKPLVVRGTATTECIIALYKASTSVEARTCSTGIKWSCSSCCSGCNQLFTSRALVVERTATTDCVVALCQASTSIEAWTWIAWVEWPGSCSGCSSGYKELTSWSLVVWRTITTEWIITKYSASTAIETWVWIALVENLFAPLPNKTDRTCANEFVKCSCVWKAGATVEAWNIVANSVYKLLGIIGSFGTI